YQRPPSPVHRGALGPIRRGDLSRIQLQVANVYSRRLETVEGERVEF
ncbi:MAG: hypothetical protein ACI8PT_004151, partial [Gammaproteobacteria bacterium]